MVLECSQGIPNDAVSFQPLLEAPIEEESIYLEPEIHQQTDDKGGKKTVPAGSANTVGEARGVAIASFLRCTPQLTTVFALPDNIVLTTIQLPDHENGPYTTSDDDERPQELADLGPGMRTV